MADLLFFSVILTTVLNIARFILEKYYSVISVFANKSMKYKFTSPSNPLDLLFRLLLNSFILFYYFNIHFFLLQVYSIKTSLLGYIVRLIMFIVSSIFATLFVHIDIIEYILLFLFYFFYSITYVIVLALYLLCYDRRLLDFILFRHSPNDLIDLLYIFFAYIRHFLLFYIRIVLMVLHLTNPISLIRLIELGRYDVYLVFRSSVLIVQDVFFTLAYVFNCIFIVSFIKAHILYFSSYTQLNANNDNDEDNDNDEYEVDIFVHCVRYNRIKHILIMKHFHHNLTFAIGLLLFIISILLLWRIKTSFRLISSLYYQDNLKLFCIEYAINITDGLLDICKAIALIINHFSIVHISSLYRTKRHYPSVSYMTLNLIVFINKSFDCLITIISLLRSITVVLIAFTIRNKGRIAYFPLLFDTDHFIQYGSTKEDNPKRIEDINVLQFYYSQRRNKLLWITTSNLYHNLLILINCLCVIDPFTLLKKVKCLYFFFYDSFTNHNLRFKVIKKKFFCKCFQTTLNVLYDIAYFIPINILLCITGPWCIPGLVRFCLRINKKRIGKIKANYSTAVSNNREDTYYTEVTLYQLKSFIKFNTVLKEQFRYYVSEWIIRLKLIFIHGNVFRVYFFWHNYLMPKNKDKEKRKPLRNLIKKHFLFALYEFPFAPLVLIYMILEPWNWFKFLAYFKLKTFRDKDREILTLTKVFFVDLLTLIILIMLLLSVINTKSCLMLIIRSIRKSILKDNESIAQYEAYYSKDFKEEVRRIYTRNLKKLFSILLFILNILLITRAAKLYKRTKPFFILFFKELQMKFQSLFNRNNKGNHSFTLQPISSLSTIYICSISEFLSPPDLLSLSLCSSSINLKYKSNILWKIYFENYYNKKLKESLTEEQYAEFNPERYANYKEACKQATSLILAKNRLKNKEVRDKIIGFCRIVEEETIESILRIPHLLLAPIKALTCLIILLDYGFYIILHKAMNTRYFYYTNSLLLKTLYEDLHQETFYSVHLLIYKAITNLLRKAFIDFLFHFVICNSIAMTLRLISLVPIKNEEATVQRMDKIAWLPWYKKIIQNILLIAIFNILIVLFIIHLSHVEEIKEVLKDYQGLSLYSLISFRLLGRVFDVLWEMRLLTKFKVIFGPYGLHLAYAFFYFVVIKSLFDTLSRSYIYIFDILKSIFFKVKYLLFPMHFSLELYKDVFFTFYNEPKIIRIVFFNILAWIIVLLPFILCFFVQFSLFKIVVLVAYGLANMYMIDNQ